MLGPGPRPGHATLHTVAPADPQEPLGGLMRNVSPAGDLLAKQALGKLQGRLFGRRRTAITVGRYELGERIGSGGAGVVYRARDPKHERDVALKLLHAGRGPGYEAARARLLREAQSLAKLSHANVVRIYDVGTYDPTVLESGPDGPPELDDVLPDEGVYLTMELVEGTDLAQWLAQEDRDWQAIHRAFLAAGRGLTAAHALGLVHRDFKPANVVIDDEGEVRVLDFGLARPTDDEGPDPSMQLTAGAKQRLNALAEPWSAPLTAPGALLGTPAYMAPEQHERRPATVRSDQYAFCLSLFEAWTGRLPFLAQDEGELSALKREGRLIDPPEDCPVPRHHFETLRRGLSPRAEDRFDSMEALLEALCTTKAPRRMRAPIWLGASGVVLLGVGVGSWFLGSADPSTADPPRDVPSARAQSPAASSVVEASDRGRRLLTQDRLDEAEAALTEALWSRADDGRHPAVVEATIDLLELARRRDPRPPDTALWVQQARTKAGSPELSLDHRLRLYLGLGQLAHARGDTRSARIDLDRGLELSASQPANDWHDRLQRARDALPKASP